MKNSYLFSIGKRIISFKYAFQGIIQMFRTEHNAWIHLIAALVVVVAGILLKISRDEWFFVIVAIGLVVAAELVNTAIETLCNVISPEKNEQIRHVKDFTAGAVLILAMAASILGIVIFVPKITALI